jgi:hypothetical protein
LKLLKLTGEGATPRDALEALAFDLNGKLNRLKQDRFVVVVEKKWIEPFGKQPGYEGYEASVDLSKT